MNQVHSTIDQIKRKAWEEKKTDTTNLEFSQKIYHDKVKAEAEFTNSVVKAKKDYYGDLSKQDFQNKQMSELQTNKRRTRADRDPNSDSCGFEFECYTRDKIIHQERLKTRDFNKEQRVNELWKKAVEKEEIQF